jgi:hypothetical protein
MVSSDPNDLGVNQFHHVLELQWHEAEAGKELVDFITTDWVEAGGHDDAPEEVICNTGLCWCPSGQ